MTLRSFDQRPAAPLPPVLFVEDEASVREVAVEALRRAGFEVTAVGTCDAALDAIPSRPDLRVLVTDVFTPGRLDGYELARIARERFPKISVIVTSARARPGQGDMAFGAWFLAKPFNLDALVGVVREAAHIAERDEGPAAR